jgi:hypothetical protein
MPQELSAPDVVRVRPARLEWVLGALVASVALALPLLASLLTLELLAALIAILGVFAVIVYRNRPVACLAALAITAWCSRTVLDLLGANIRVEQPAVVILAAWLLWRYHGLALQLLRQYVVAITGIAVWLIAMFASSYLNAPDRGASLRIEAWLCVSILSAGVAAVLVVRFRANQDASPIFIAAALVQVCIALFALVTGRFLGLAWGGYLLQGDSGLFRAFGLVWEPNIFGSAAGIVLPFAIDRYVRLGRLVDLVAVALLSIGLGMALTRATWIAVFVGLAFYVGIIAIRERTVVTQRIRLVSAGLSIVLLGTFLGFFLTVWGQTASPGLLAQRPPESAPVQVPALAIGIAAPTPTIGPSPSSGPAPSGPTIAVDLASSENVSYRIERIAQALRDVLKSPVIGLGANSYGQRHLDKSQPPQPDYLSTFPITILYEAGFVGTAGFAVFGLAMVWALWRSANRRLAAPFLASMAIMAIAYASTDALRFSQNWLIFGAGLGLAFRPMLSVEGDGG